MTSTQEISAKKLYKSKIQVSKKRKDIKLLVICSEISRTQIPHYVATSHMNCDKIQTTGLHKTRGNKAGNLRLESSNESQ